MNGLVRKVKRTMIRKTMIATKPILNVPFIITI